VKAGWTYLSRTAAEKLRGDTTNPIFTDIFIERVLALNKGIVNKSQTQELAKQLIRVPPTKEGNLYAWEFLRGLRTVFVPSEKRERNVRFIDPVNLENNVFHVTDEFKFFNGVRAIRADIVFLINGTPVILVETKSAVRLDGIAEGLDQISRYHRDTPEFLAITQVFGLTHLVHYFYGATWNTSHKNLYNWKEENIDKEDFESLVKAFFEPARVLDMLHDFILFTRKDEELQKIILRPHQMRAVERTIERVLTTDKRRGLIWHTQGSGKTYTMITVAKRLMEEPALENPTILMLVDRNELESQLFGNLVACGLSVCIAESKKDLQELLKNDTRGVIVSMIHKFDDIPANINIRKNLIVLVDEAHRTTGGNLGNYLMGALPNATYIGFTGTPIDKTAYGKGTFKVFGGEDTKGYLDKYSIAESIEDGTTVQLYYALAPNELLIDKEKLEEEFFSLAEAEGVSDIEDLNKVLDKAVNLKNMLKNRERVDGVAKYVTEHFKGTVEPMGYKAFLVGVDREACCLLKDALDKYLPPDYSQVVISTFHNDRQDIAKYCLSEEDEKKVRKAFIKPSEIPKILIVTEKLLTGYDAPILYCMYLDKPMRDHVLLQAIARVNRPYEDENGRRKPGGFVLDFVGIFDNFKKALAFDSKDVKGLIFGIDILKQRFKAMIDEGRRKYIKIIEGKTADKAVEAILKAFLDPEKRQDYYTYFRQLEGLYEIISPDPFLRDFMDDYQKLVDIYSILRSKYDSSSLAMRELARKTAKLVQDRVIPGQIYQPDKTVAITPETLRQLAEGQQSEIEKVIDLGNGITMKVNREGTYAPYLFSIGERAQIIIEKFKERQLTTQEALKQLEELIAELSQAENEQQKSGLDGSAFAVLWLVEKEGILRDKAELAAKEMTAAFTKYPFWQKSEDQARHIRTSLYQALEPTDAADIPGIVDKIMTVLMREQS
jgi:type I restriction enzyme R subunit